MRFCDRRAIYEQQIPTLEIREEEITGKYRGTSWYSRRLTAPYSRQKTAKEQSQRFIGVQLRHQKVRETSQYSFN
ncbi:hypothetical protein IQ238_18040 [Pleurocapsales cyanobacterium LEGE 06147]|nr:hypothetical protein [Pleurocapsales cyanobacterium LEGE 06147]